MTGASGRAAGRSSTGGCRARSPQSSQYASVIGPPHRRHVIARVLSATVEIDRFGRRLDGVPTSPCPPAAAERPVSVSARASALELQRAVGDDVLLHLG